MMTVDVPTDSATMDKVSPEERLARFGDRAGKHGPLATIQVLIPVRVSRDTGLAANKLARKLGLRRATWAAQGLAVLAQCHPDDWFRAIAAFQGAMKTRAPSETMGA
jgi:hypothetical protein